MRAVAAAPLPDKRFITAVRDSDDRLRVTAWSVSEDGRDITRLPTETGPTILDVTAASAADGAVITARRPDGRLYVTGAGLDGNRLILHDGETFEGKADNLALASGTSNMLAMRDSDGLLRVTQMLTTGSHRPQRGGTASGGAISAVDAAAFDAAIEGEWVTFRPGPGRLVSERACLAGDDCSLRTAWES